MIPWTVAHQASLFMEFSRQENWSGLPFPSPGDLPDPEIKARSPAWLADSLPSEPPERTLPLIVPYLSRYLLDLDLWGNKQMNKQRHACLEGCVWLWSAGGAQAEV